MDTPPTLPANMLKNKAIKTKYSLVNINVNGLVKLLFLHNKVMEKKVSIFPSCLLPFLSNDHNRKYHGKYHQNNGDIVDNRVVI